MTTPDGARTTYLYNEENLLSRIKYADGAVVRYTYDANGNRIGEEDENGAKTTFVYDALGRVVEVNGEEGLHYAYRYDGEGNLIEAEDALGNRVSMEYDGNGNLIKETNQLGESRSYAYTPLGDVESITDEAGRTTCYQYQKGGLLEKIRYADGTEEAFTYDANGNLETHTLATGFVLTYGYDSMDRIVEIMGSEGEKKSYTYDALRNVTSMTDGEGNTTRYAYTLSGQLAKVTDALGNETEYQYDACDRLTEIRQYGAEGSLKEDTEISGMDADFLEAERQNGRKRRCQITRYTRDLRGQVTETVDALGQKETYTYDKKGQLLGKLDKEGYLTKYAYTKQGDLSGIQYADGKEVKLSYNPLRQLIEIQDWLGSTRITPDALGRAEKVQYPDGREVSYTYGKAGERRSITYPDGKTVFYGYDEQFRLSELKEGDSIITYGYDTVGRLCEKQFPNGTKTTYRYDRKDQLTELLHQDQEGILDRYTYLYDLLGNKTGITKERRGLERESGQYRYGYDALGRLSEIQKDGEIQYRYGYDAFGNRTWKEESGEQTSYQYNALNQMVSERQGEIRKEYGYDKRGNLTAILENGAWKKQYVYGAMNRLEEAVDAAGKQARYQYNGLGHRVGKQEGVLPKEKLEKLDPQRRVGMEIGNSRQITYTLDLTRQYYNLLERTEESQSQRYFWDGNVAAYEENGERNYYLQDELGSPLRIEDSAGTIKESYGYGAFGEDLYQNQGEMQPFGYTGYQRDEIAGTYYAQAREYLAESGRFAGQDLIAGFMDLPFSMNRYSYCFNTPVVLVDLDGAWPKWITDIGGAIDEGVQWVENKVSSAIRWGYEEIWSKHIYGEDLVLYETTTGGGSYEVTSHRGGSIIVAQKDILGNFTGWTLDLSINLPHGLKVGSKLTGKDWNPETWKYNHGIEYTNQDTGISYKGGTYMDKNGIGYNHVYGGTSGNLPLELPDSTKIDEYADVSWSFSQDFQISNWKLILETVGVVTAAILFVVVVLDDATIVGVLDDAALAPLAAYIASVAPSFYQWFINSAPKMATCGG